MASVDHFSKPGPVVTRPTEFDSLFRLTDNYSRTRGLSAKIVVEPMTINALKSRTRQIDNDSMIDRLLYGLKPAKPLLTCSIRRTQVWPNLVLCVGHTPWCRPTWYVFIDNTT